MARGKSSLAAPSTPVLRTPPATDVVGRVRNQGWGALLNYEVITDATALQRLIHHDLAAPQQLALDIETASLRGWGVHRGTPRLIQVGWETAPGELYQAVIDVFAVDPTPLVRLLGDGKRELVIHHAPFEQAWFAYHFGQELPRVLDTVVAFRHINQAAAVADPTHQPWPNNKLATIAERFFGRPMAKEEQGSWWGRPLLSDSQLDYAALDVAILPHLARVAREEINRLHLATGVAREQAENNLRVEREVQRSAAQRGPDAARVMQALRRADTTERLQSVWRASFQASMPHSERDRVRALYQERLAQQV